MEGLRWPWNAWPLSRSDAAALVVPLSVMCSPLMPLADLPLLPYDPLLCVSCCGALNPYARVDYRAALWTCPFCSHKNHFPRSYAGIGENNLPAELFPTYSTVEYVLSSNPRRSPGPRNVFGPLPSSSASTSSLSGLDESPLPGPAFVFVIDVCSEQGELRALKNELLHIVARLPENALVGLISFGSMVWVHDLGYTDCPKVMLFSGDRELSSEKVDTYLYLFDHDHDHLCHSFCKVKTMWITIRLYYPNDCFIIETNSK